VVLGSCYEDDGVSREAAQLWRWREGSGINAQFYWQADCIAKAGGGCRALDDCLGYRLEAVDICMPGRTCGGSVFKHCFELPGYGNVEEQIDCATIRFECDPRATCVGDPIVTCDPLSYVETCDGVGFPLSCPAAGVVRPGPWCEATGLVCDVIDQPEGEPSLARCVGTGAPCTAPSGELLSGIACAGNVLEACANGRRQDFDCSAFDEGFSCQTVQGIPFCGLAAECLPANLQGSGDRDVSQNGDPEPTCDGDSIVFCNAGRLERVDCTELGFSGCENELGCVPSPKTELAPQMAFLRGASD
jgi:hypothetical protein